MRKVVELFSGFIAFSRMGAVDNVGFEKISNQNRPESPGHDKHVQ